MVLFLQAFVVLGILFYMHVVFARTPVNCLSHVAESWPRHGILRVEIVRNASENYSIINSYEKVYCLVLTKAFESWLVKMLTDFCSAC